MAVTLTTHINTITIAFVIAEAEKKTHYAVTAGMQMTRATTVAMTRTATPSMTAPTTFVMGMLVPLTMTLAAAQPPLTPWRSQWQYQSQQFAT